MPPKKTTKQSLGQFYTTNVVYILQHLSIPKTTSHIIEPFSGNGDLVRWANMSTEMECYDIDPKQEYIVQRDTILEPPSYIGKFVLTNPPYLARNKSANKTAFDKYKTNDLYKCVIQEWLQTENRPNGGILIIPLNFWSSIRKSDVELRASFLRIYNIVHLNIFEESVFDDTTTTVCSFQFQLRIDHSVKIPVCMFPDNSQICVSLCEENSYTIGGEIYKLATKHRYTITRLTSRNVEKQNTQIRVKCIDDNATHLIGWTIEPDVYIDDTPNQTARTYATLVIEPPISLEIQKKVAYKCNELLNGFREKYHSLFLSNYRESKDIARKRISFDLVYLITEYVLDTLEV